MTKNRNAIQALLALPLIAVVIAIATSQASAGIYPWPTNWSLGGIASWSQPLIASGPAIPPAASGSAGDLFILYDIASTTLFRHNGTDFYSIAGGNNFQDIVLGSGTPDAFISRIATGVVQIASYVVLVPEIATPTSPATGTLWFDLNESPPKMKCFDGTDWQPLW